MQLQIWCSDFHLQYLKTTKVCASHTIYHPSWQGQLPPPTDGSCFGKVRRVSWILPCNTPIFRSLFFNYLPTNCVWWLGGWNSWRFKYSTKPQEFQQATRWNTYTFRPWANLRMDLWGKRNILVSQLRHHVVCLFPHTPPEVWRKSI